MTDETKNFKTNLRNRLRDLRGNATQQDVAKGLSKESGTISTGTISSWETGRTSPTIDMLPKIAKYFRISTDELLGVKHHTAPKLVNTKSGLTWTLRLEPHSSNEKSGVRAWKQLMSGEKHESIIGMLQLESNHRENWGSVERVVLDVIDTGMIQIIDIPCDNSLVEEVKAKFSFLEDIVVVSMPLDLPLRLRTVILGEAAANFFRKKVQPSMQVGISGGYSVGRMIYSLKRGDCRNIDIYPLASVPFNQALTLDANTLSSVFVNRHFGYHIRGYKLPYVNRRDIREEKSDRYVYDARRILAVARAVKIAFIGIGSIDNRHELPVDWLSELMGTDTINKLRDKGAIGDILYHFVDKNGNMVANEISDYVCSIELSDLQRLIDTFNSSVVIVSAGAHKAGIVSTAIKHKYANNLIIDDELAKALL